MKKYLLGIVFALASAESGSAANNIGTALPEFIMDMREVSLAINHPKNDSTSKYRTAEAWNSLGFDAMNAEYAYAKGYDGSRYSRTTSGALRKTSPASRVIVAVIDSGVDTSHTDLDSNIRLSHAVKCTITGGCSSYAGDPSGHGTKVAGVIAAEKNNVGMHGVAYKSYILPVSALISGGSDLQGFNYALDKGAKVINASYAVVTDDGEIPIITAKSGDRDDALSASSMKSYLSVREKGINVYDVMKKLIAKDAIAVFAAGNAGMDQVGILAGLPHYFRGNVSNKPSGYSIINPENLDISGNWVAAAAVEPYFDGSKWTWKIASFSNRCGVARNKCLVAPGDDIYTTKKGGGYSTTAGTSFSAPNVSAAIAIVSGAFNHLSSRQVMEILYNTATDLGKTGVDSVYGRGLINLKRATEPTDSKWKITTTSKYTKSTSDFTESGINLPASFGDVTKRLAKKEVMFLDEYDRNFYIGMGALVGSSQYRISAEQMLAEFGSPEVEEVRYGQVKMGLALAEDQYGSANSIDDPTRDVSGKNKMSLTYAQGLKSDAKLTTQLTHNLNLANVAGSRVVDTRIKNQFSHSQSFKNPYLGFAENVNASIVGYEKNGLGLKAAAFSGDAGYDNYEFSNDKAMRGAMAEISYMKKGSGVSIGLGANMEENTLLGAESDGALKLGDNANTYYAGVNGRYKVNSRLSLLGSYNAGVTKMDKASGSLFRDVEDIVSDSFSVGAEYNGLVNPKDSLLVAVSQPLRVRSGSADISLPVSINSNGAVGYENERLNLSPSGREIDMEIFYSTPFRDDDSEVRVGGIYRNEPGHDKDARDESIFMVKYRQSF